MPENLESHGKFLSQCAKEKYTERLWQRATELSEERNSLEQRRQQLFDQSAQMRRRQLNLNERQILVEIEGEYWRVIEKIQEIKALEDKIIKALQDIESGTADETELEELSPPPAEKQISKKKKHILEEKQRFGVDPRESSDETYSVFGSNPTRLTTGRHQKDVKGVFDPMDAAGEFFYRTADTHGGKVSHGKKSFYSTKGGRRLRKI